MKIKALGLTEEQILQGFKINNIYEVLKFEISGDSNAYDIFYQIESEINTKTWIQDITSEIISTSKRYSKAMKDFNEYFDKISTKLHCKFSFKVDLKQ